MSTAWTPLTLARHTVVASRLVQSPIPLQVSLRIALVREALLPITWKYAARGFAIAVPGYQPKRVCRSLVAAEYAAFPDHDAIFLFGELQRQPEEMSSAHASRNFAAPSTVVSEDVKVTMKQCATVAQDLERLIVKDRLHIRQLVPPEVKHCDKHNRKYCDAPHVSNACMPVSTGAKDGYWLLRGVDAKKRPPSSDTSDTEGEEEGSYEKTPLARVYELFQKYVDRELHGPAARVALSALDGIQPLA